MDQSQVTAGRDRLGGEVWPVDGQVVISFGLELADRVGRFTLGTAIPASSVMDLASARSIRLLDLAPYIEGLRKLNPGFVGVPIPANTYSGQAQAVTVPDAVTVARA